MKNRLYIILGIILTILGSVGVFIPLLPTTPFLLVAATFFYKSSPKLHYWLLNNKILGKYISDYLNKKGMPMKIKLFTLCLLWITIIYSIVFVVNEMIISILLGVIASSVTIHILRIKTKRL